MRHLICLAEVTARHRKLGAYSEICVCYSCELSSAPLNVAVLLSGGVDSSFALHLLKRAGHHVTAFYLQIWFQEDFRNYWDSCPWEDDLSYCQQVVSPK